jgi:hypothetical protein
MKMKVMGWHVAHTEKNKHQNMGLKGESKEKSLEDVGIMGG